MLIHLMHGEYDIVKQQVGWHHSLLDIDPDNNFC